MVTEHFAIHHMAERVTRPVLSPDEQLLTSLSIILIADFSVVHAHRRKPMFQVVFGFLEMRILFPSAFLRKQGTMAWLTSGHKPNVLLFLQEWDQMDSVIV